MSASRIAIDHRANLNAHPNPALPTALAADLEGTMVDIDTGMYQPLTN